MIQVRDIQPTFRKGSVIGTDRGLTHTVYNADIEPGKSVRLHGYHQHTPFDVTFEIGGIAEYDSYNLHYLGEIQKITQKTITINGKSTGSGNKRLSLYEFSWRNYDFNLQKHSKHNLEEMQVI